MENYRKKWLSRINNQIKLIDIIQAIITFPSPSLNIYTDSNYVFKAGNQYLWIELDLINLK